MPKHFHPTTGTDKYHNESGTGTRSGKRDLVKLVLIDFKARQYYELLYQRPDELVNTVEESGPKYSLEAYLTALSLSYK